MRPKIPESEIQKDLVYVMSVSLQCQQVWLPLCRDLWTEVCHWQKKSLCALPARQNWTSVRPKTETWHCPMVPVWIYEVINFLWVSTFSLHSKPMALMKDGKNYAGTICVRKTTLPRWTPALDTEIEKDRQSDSIDPWEGITRAKVTWSLII